MGKGIKLLIKIRFLEVFIRRLWAIGQFFSIGNVEVEYCRHAAEEAEEVEQEGYEVKKTGKGT